MLEPQRRDKRMYSRCGKGCLLFLIDTLAIREMIGDARINPKFDVLLELGRNLQPLFEGHLEIGVSKHVRSIR